MTLQELAEEYTRSLRLITDRLQELRKNPEENATRIRDLENLARTTMEIRNVCRDYYKKEAYIHAAYTVRYTGQRATRRVPKLAPGKRRDERRINKSTTAASVGGNPARTDSTSAGAIADEILRRLFGAGDLPTARH